MTWEAESPIFHSSTTGTAANAFLCISDLAAHESVITTMVHACFRRFAVAIDLHKDRTSSTYIHSSRVHIHSITYEQSHSETYIEI